MQIETICCVANAYMMLLLFNKVDSSTAEYKEYCKNVPVMPIKLSKILKKIVEIHWF